MQGLSWAKLELARVGVWDEMFKQIDLMKNRINFIRWANELQSETTNELLDEQDENQQNIDPLIYE